MDYSEFELKGVKATSMAAVAPGPIGGQTSAAGGEVEMKQNAADGLEAKEDG